MSAGMNGEVAARIAAFLDAHHVMSLATCGPQGPHAASLFYARDGFSLLWLSHEQTRHSEALAINPLVGATIAPDYRGFAEIRGIQISGSARRLVNVADRRHARSVLEARYPFLLNVSNQAPFMQAYAAAELYRLVPHKIVIIDNTRGFGHNDVLELKGSED